MFESRRRKAGITPRSLSSLCSCTCGSCCQLLPWQVHAAAGSNHDNPQRLQKQEQTLDCRGSSSSSRRQRPGSTPPAPSLPSSLPVPLPPEFRRYALEAGSMTRLDFDISSAWYIARAIRQGISPTNEVAAVPLCSPWPASRHAAWRSKRWMPALLGPEAQPSHRRPSTPALRCSESPSLVEAVAGHLLWRAPHSTYFWLKCLQSRSFCLCGNMRKEDPALQDLDFTKQSAKPKKA